MVNAALLEREASGALMSHAVAWDTKNKLEFPVPYSDLKPTIFLGTCMVNFCNILLPNLMISLQYYYTLLCIRYPHLEFMSCVDMKECPTSCLILFTILEFRKFL